MYTIRFICATCQTGINKYYPQNELQCSCIIWSNIKMIVHVSNTSELNYEIEIFNPTFMTERLECADFEIVKMLF